MPRLAYGADLSHQAKLVLHGPGLGDLAFLYGVDGDAHELHLLATRRDAHIVSPVGGTTPPASHHFILLGYEVLNGAYHIREASPEICCLLLGSFDLSGCKEFYCSVEVAGMVPELSLLPAHYRLL